MRTIKAVTRKIFLNKVQVHLLHRGCVVTGAVVQQPVLADELARKLRGVVKDDAFKEAAIRERGGIRKFRENVEHVVACEHRVGVREGADAGGTGIRRRDHP